MITLIVTGIIIIAVAAVVVGIIDAAQAPGWREVAAERRQRWEERVHEVHGGVEAPEPDWDDD